MWDKDAFRSLYDISNTMAVTILTRQGTSALSQYPIRRVIVRSRRVLKSWVFLVIIVLLLWNLTGSSEALNCCLCAWQFQSDTIYFNTRSRAFETLRDLTTRRLIGYWNGAAVVSISCIAFGVLQDSSLTIIWAINQTAKTSEIVPLHSISCYIISCYHANIYFMM